MTAIHDLTPHLDAHDGYGADCWGTREGVVLAIQLRAQSPLPARFRFGYVGPEGSCRREYQGLELPGPYAYAWPLSVSLTAEPGTGTAAEIARNRAAGTEWDAAIGDEVIVRGYRFRIDADGPYEIKLTLLGEAAADDQKDLASRVREALVMAGYCQSSSLGGAWSSKGFGITLHSNPGQVCVQAVTGGVLRDEASMLSGYESVLDAAGLRVARRAHYLDVTAA